MNRVVSEERGARSVIDYCLETSPKRLSTERWREEIRKQGLERKTRGYKSRITYEVPDRISILQVQISSILSDIQANDHRATVDADLWWESSVYDIPWHRTELSIIQ